MKKDIEIIWNNRITVQNLYILETVVMSTAVCQAETVDPQSQEKKMPIGLSAYWVIVGFRGEVWNEIEGGTWK